MSRKYKFHDPEGLYFISYAVVYWIDVFTRDEYKEILLNSWKYCQQNKGLEIFAWCIMTNHVHMIIASEKNKPEEIIRDMKSFTSTQIKKAITENPQESRKEWMLEMMHKAGTLNNNNNDFQFWQQHNNPIQLTSNAMIDQKLDYIHQNPVIAGIVDHPEYYLYSSARDYAGLKGLIDISFLD
jgi:putative transposase